MRRLWRYLNPIHRLGYAKYSFFLPVVANASLILASEFFAYYVTNNPLIVGRYIIFLNAAFVLYFAFRDGIRGGFISAFAAVSYYLYIIYSRNYSGQQLVGSIEATAALGLVYFLLAIVVGWLKQTIDKLILREADEKRRLNTIIEQLPVGVIITDDNGKIVQRNKRLDAILGVRLPLGFVIGQDTLKKELVNDKPIDPTKSPLYNALKRGKPVLGMELSYRRKDKKQMFLQINSAPIFNSKKKIIAAVSIISDVTNLKELEKSKDEFLGIASHELKTPVTSIKAYAQVLKVRLEKRGDPQTVEYVKKLDSQIDKLTGLIKDLLDVTKIQAGRLEHDREIFELNSLIKNIAGDIQVTTKHTIVTKLGKVTNVYAAKDRIGQVLTNLITNGIKYSPDSKKIIITTLSAKGFATVCVEDFGVGIPKDEQGRVFDQFFRVRGQERSTFPGLGLGLYVSSEIIKSENGKIWVEGKTGKGSKFCFRVPLSDVELTKDFANTKPLKN